MQPRLATFASSPALAQRPRIVPTTAAFNTTVTTTYPPAGGGWDDVVAGPLNDLPTPFSTPPSPLSLRGALNMAPCSL